jgi:hypothetical protein
MFVVHAEHSGQISDPHCAAASFELFDQIHSGPPRMKFYLTSYRSLLVSNTSAKWGHLFWLWGIRYYDG